LHPLTQVTEDIVRAFRKIGFAAADGPEIEDEYHCFDALNTPADHPARDERMESVRSAPQDCPERLRQSEVCHPRSVGSRQRCAARREVNT
jgi:hypothetical protein